MKKKKREMSCLELCFLCMLKRSFEGEKWVILFLRRKIEHDISYELSNMKYQAEFFEKIRKIFWKRF